MIQRLSGIPNTHAQPPRFGNAAPFIMLGVAATAATKALQNGSQPAPVYEGGDGDDWFFNAYHAIRDAFDAVVHGQRAGGPTISRAEYRELEALRAEHEKAFPSYLKTFQADLKRNLFEFGNTVASDTDDYNNVTSTLPVTYNGEPWELVQRVHGSGDGAEYKLQTVAKTQHEGDTLPEKCLTLYTGSAGPYSGYSDFSGDEAISAGGNSKRGSEKTYNFFKQLISASPMTFHESSVPQPQKLYGWLLPKKIA